MLKDHELLLVDKKIELNLNETKTQELITLFSPEIIIHLAASFERTDETPQFHKINFEDNILATYNLNRVISSLKVAPKQYIFASSYLVYDPFLYLTDYPIAKNNWARQLSEVDEISPRNLIGASKLYGENEINYLKRNIYPKMKVTHLRIFRVFGEGGQEFVSRLIEWQKLGIPVDIWKPENRFDYVYTGDCASAIVSTFGHEGVFNVGYGVSTSIKNIIDLVKPKVRIISKNDQYEASCADTDLITEVTGWIPKVNVLDWIKEKL